VLEDTLSCIRECALVLVEQNGGRAHRQRIRQAHRRSSLQGIASRPPQEFLPTARWHAASRKEFLKHADDLATAVTMHFHQRGSGLLYRDDHFVCRWGAQQTEPEGTNFRLFGKRRTGR
jgi:hypothetical protein